MEKVDKMPKRDIALFLPSLRGGGAERVMLTLAQGFAERGFAVDLVLAKAEGHYLSQVPREVRVVDLNSRRVLASLPKLMRYLRQVRPKALFSSLSHANVIALWAKRLSGIPTRVIVREASTLSISSANAPSLRGRFLPYVMRWTYPWANEVIAVSHGVANDLVKTLSLPPEKVHVIYNPVAISEIQKKAHEPLDHPWFLPGSPPVILGVGRLTKAKDFPTLIKAFALVRQEQAARLLILGEGEERPYLDALVRELSLEESVALPGFVENPFKYMARASLFVLSSAWEGFPNVLVQAIAVGTPVVSTDCQSGPSEILEKGKWGKLVPVGDVKALASGIIDTLNNPPDSMYMRKRAEAFDADVIVSQYAKVLGIGDE